ncbi:MAG: hypothetical protein ACYTGB_19360 [Planctomycetota bacterium]
MAESRRERRARPGVREEAHYYALRRCCQPACRRRDGLEVHAMSGGSAPPGLAEVITLCSSCHGDAGRGRYSTAELQRWKLATMDYYENVGAE